MHAWLLTYSETCFSKYLSVPQYKEYVYRRIDTGTSEKHRKVKNVLTKSLCEKFRTEIINYIIKLKYIGNMYIGTMLSVSQRHSCISQVIIWTPEGPISYASKSLIVIFLAWYNCCIYVLNGNKTFLNWIERKLVNTFSPWELRIGLIVRVRDTTAEHLDFIPFDNASGVMISHQMLCTERFNTKSTVFDCQKTTNLQNSYIWKCMCNNYPSEFKGHACIRNANDTFANLWHVQRDMHTVRALSYFCVLIRSIVPLFIRITSLAREQHCPVSWKEACSTCIK